MEYMGILNSADTFLGYVDRDHDATRVALVYCTIDLPFHVLSPPITSSMSITPRKRTQNDENTTQTPTFVNYSGPPTKKPRRVLQPITPQIRNEPRRIWLEKDKEAEKKKSLQEQQMAEEKQKLETSRLEEMERARIAAGHTSLFAYISELFGTKDRRLSSLVFLLKSRKCL